MWSMEDILKTRDTKVYLYVKREIDDVGERGDFHGQGKKGKRSSA